MLRQEKILEEFELVDDNREFLVTSYQLSSGEHEVIVRSNPSHKLSQGTSRILMIGRSLQVDRFLPDVWFYFDENGIIRSDYREIKNRFVAYDLKALVRESLRNNYDKFPQRWASWFVFENIMDFISASASQHLKFADQLFSEQVEILLAEKRLAHDKVFLRLAIEHPELIDWQIHSISLAWLEVHEKYKAHQTDFWLMSAVDIATAGFGAWGTTKLLERYLPKIAISVKSSFQSRVQVFLERWRKLFSQSLMQKASQAQYRLQIITEASMLSAAKLLGRSGLSLSGINRIQLLASFLNQKAKLATWVYSNIHQALKVSGHVAANTLSLAAVEGTAVSGFIDLTSKYIEEIDTDRLFDTRPVIVKRELWDAYTKMQNKPGNLEDLIKTMLGTTLSVGINNTMKAAGVSYLKSALFLGVINAAYSATMDLYIKGKVDPNAVGWEVGWNLLISNMQSHGIYPQVASRLKNIALNSEVYSKGAVTVGYLVTVIDQIYWKTKKDNLLNYISQNTQNIIDENYNKEIHDVPSVEQAEIYSAQPQTAAAIKNYEIKLIPIVVDVSTSAK